jgi:poly(glycerol-phosphate) alpha-glucosyltransferase
MEAWAYGKPVIMTPQCNAQEGFEAQAAVRVEAEKESIARGLTHFMSMDDEERQCMGANGRTLAERRFAFPIIMAQMGGVYRWVAGRGPKPDCVSTP